MAVGIIIGGAFGTIAKSLVADVIMPPIGLALGGVDFSNLKLPLKEPVLDEAGKVVTAEVAVNYGTFINNLVSFLIVSFAVFVLVKGINRLKRKEAIAPSDPTTRACPHCYSEVSIKATRCAHCTSELSAA
jgi:large conductance mechanosensitive channel